MVKLCSEMARMSTKQCCVLSTKMIHRYPRFLVKTRRLEKIQHLKFKVMSRNQYNIYIEKLGIQESIQDNDERGITYNIRRSMLHKPNTTMTTYIVLGDGEELTAVNLHNHFVEEANTKSPSVSASELDRFFGPGPVATTTSAGSQLSSSSSTTTDLIPAFKTQFWLVEQPWYDERWVLRPDLINNYSLCGDIDSVSSDLTEEFDLNLDLEIQTSCSSLTDTCNYPTLTSTSKLSTLDEEDNDIVYPKITSFESLSSLSLNSFDVDSVVSIMGTTRKKSILRRMRRRRKLLRPLIL